MKYPHLRLSLTRAGPSVHHRPTLVLMTLVSLPQSEAVVITSKLAAHDADRLCVDRQDSQRKESHANLIGKCVCVCGENVTGMMLMLS